MPDNLDPAFWQISPTYTSDNVSIGMTDGGVTVTCSAPSSESVYMSAADL